jgi:deoxyadenosine/deoxycytidine kinase
MMIWLSGPTGAGKTSLARSLRASGYSIVAEDVPAELFSAFLSEPTVHCEPLQRYIMQARYDGWRNVSGLPRIAFDRSIDEDIEVFCKMHRRAGLLTTEQFDRLAQYGRSLQAQIPEPDLIVSVTADQDVLRGRLQNLAGPALIIDNLKEQISLYTEWLQNRSGEILELDTTRLSERTMAKLFSEISSC